MKKSKNRSKPAKRAKARAPGTKAMVPVRRQTAPVSAGANVVATAPTMTRGPNGSIRVRHRELISNILGSVGFAVQALQINPGLAAAFPWLAGIAQRYESYIFHGLEFMYETMRSTSVDGVISMAVDYDASDLPPSSRVDLMAHQGAVRSATWQAARFRALATALRKRKTNYVRTGPIDPSDNIKSYDVGTIYVGSEGMSDDKAVGELYVEYDVELQTPVLESGATQQSNVRALRFYSPGPRQGSLSEPIYYVPGNAGYLGVPAAATDIDPNDNTLWQAQNMRFTLDASEWSRPGGADMFISPLSKGKEFSFAPGYWQMDVISTHSGGANNDPSFQFAIGILNGTPLDAQLLLLNSAPSGSVSANPEGGGFSLYFEVNSKDVVFTVHPLVYAPDSCLQDTEGAPALESPLTTVNITPVPRGWGTWPAGQVFPLTSAYKTTPAPGKARVKVRAGQVALVGNKVQLISVPEYRKRYPDASEDPELVSLPPGGLSKFEGRKI